MAEALRLGVVPYLNVAPIVYGLSDNPKFQFFREVPSRVADLLHRGEIDLGMIPSIEYAFGDYRIVPGIAIGGAGPVRSVNLFHRRPLHELRSVALDTSSRTSVALLKVLLRERLGRGVDFVPMAPDVSEMLRVADAALVIGDASLYFEGDLGRLDLGEQWQSLTGLPFVFAFWAGRPGVATGSIVAELQESLRQGLGALPAIASSYNGLGGGHAATNEVYLRSNINFRFGEAEAEGLREFYKRAHALGLIPRAPELRFYGDP